MPRQRLTFRQRDVTAAVRAVERAGREVSQVRIGQDGSIVLELVSSVTSATAPEPEVNPWDKVDLSYGRKNEKNPLDDHPFVRGKKDPLR
jgi:hypothetical protein